MALVQCDFFSEVLGICSSMNVILPQPAPGQIGMAGASGAKKHPTLWLLHGLSDDHSIWLRRTSIERYVAPMGLAVVMPAVGRSFYTNMDRGLNYWTFVSEELPALARSFFPLSEKREDNFVAGLSMGGYGAFKMALNHPERFAAAASLSGVMDIVLRFKGDDYGPSQEMLNIFGSLETLEGSDNDLLHKAKQLVESDKPRPALYQCCGVQDFLYEENVRFRDYTRQIGLELTYEEGPGIHEWAFWDRYIQRVLGWLPLPA